MVAKKKKSEEPIELNSSIALSMAGDVLMQAAELAAALNDTEALLSAAKGWLEISDRLNAGEDDDEKAKKPFGFNTFDGVEIEVTTDGVERDD